MTKKYFRFLLIVSLCALGVSACNSGGGGGSESQVVGTLAADSTAKALGPGDGGISGVTISALGDSQVTDANGNFTLKADGDAFTGGPVLFVVNGDTVAGEAAFDMVAGGPGVTAYVDLMVLESGAIVGTSTDEAGNVLSQISRAGSLLGCTNNLTFSDGGGGNLWKPVSESTGTVVILMPGSYRNASFGIYNANGDQAASILKRHCCEHNGGRDHVYLTRTASSLAGEPLPLTVTYDFGGGRIDCLEVATPTWRLD